MPSSANRKANSSVYWAMSLAMRLAGAVAGLALDAQQDGRLLDGGGLQARGDLARVHGVDARVGLGREDQRRRVGAAVLRRGGRANRRRARRTASGSSGEPYSGIHSRAIRKPVVADHVGQRHAGRRRPGRAPGRCVDGRGHQQAAVRAARDGQALGAMVIFSAIRYSAAATKSSKTFCLLAEHAGAVPGLAVLAAAAQVGHGVDAAALEEGAHPRGEGRASGSR